MGLKFIFRTDNQNEARKVEKLIIFSLSVHVTILTEQPSRISAATPPTTKMKLNLPAVVAATTVPESKEFEEVID